MTDTLYAFLLSTGVIFVAELGDKSQLMAMTFAARYRARDVLIGITVATAVVHLVSVGIGAFVGDAFADYQGTISVVAGLAFLFFALWTLRGDELTDDEADKARNSQGAAIWAVGVAFFLAELGDKTMLATITLATQEGWFGTWIGSTLGMVLADALAIARRRAARQAAAREGDQVRRRRAVRDLRRRADRPGRRLVLTGADGDSSPVVTTSARRIKTTGAGPQQDGRMTDHRRRRLRGLRRPPRRGARRPRPDGGGAGRAAALLPLPLRPDDPVGRG